MPKTQTHNTPAAAAEAETQPRITDFDPTRTSGVYDALRDSWLLNRDFAEMHLHVLRSGEYLDPFGSESDAAGRSAEAGSQYAWRKGACVAIDPCADLINLRVDNLFRTAPIRSYADSPYRDFLAEFLSDVDGGGTDMTAFMRKNLCLRYVNGVEFVVDKHAAGGAAPQTLAQERALGLLPYLHAFSPLERLDWACDHAGGYLWSRYDLGQAPADDERHAGGAVRRFLTVTPHEWRLYELTDQDDGPAATVRTGPISLGLCPIVPFYFKQSTRPDYPKVPLSLLTRIAPISRYLLNLVSQIQIDIYRNIAFLVATGVSPQSIPAEIAPMGCWALPEGAKLQDVAGDVEHIRVKLQVVRTLMEAILRIGKLTGAAGEMKGRAASGVQVAVERTDLDNEMRMTACQAEQVERDLAWLAVCRYKGRLVPRSEIRYSVEYNKKYVLTPVADLVRQAREFAAMGIHTAADVPALMKILLRKILDAVSKEDDPAYQQALQEIEAAAFARAGGQGGAS